MTELGSVGKLFAEFVTKSGIPPQPGSHGDFWGESPLKPADIASLPRYMVNSEVYGPEFDPVFKAHGIRQMITRPRSAGRNSCSRTTTCCRRRTTSPSRYGGVNEFVVHGPGYVAQMLDTIENRRRAKTPT